MSYSLLVKGQFANGKSRSAGIHWPGHTITPEIHQRVQQYEKVFQKEFVEAPKTMAGLPTFEYIEIQLHKNPPQGAGTCEKIFLAVTPNSLAKLTAQYGKPINGSRGQINPHYQYNPKGIVVDLTKERTPEAFWRAVRIYTNNCRKRLFGM